MITKQQLEKSLNYNEYKALLVKLLSLGKTTGHDQSETMLSYAKLNIQRMERVEKTLQLTNEIRDVVAKVKQPYIWLVITEGWCGDTAQSVPVFHLISQLSPNIELRLLLRDDNPDVMEQYLTNGARSIPKLICIERDSLKEVFTWGPRPADLQKSVMELLNDNVPKEEKGLFVQKWYNNDRGVAIQREIKELADRHMLV